MNEIISDIATGSLPAYELRAEYTGRIIWTDIDCVEYLVNGTRHREDGPAFYSRRGRIKRYWLNNIRFNSFEEWFNTLNEEQKIIALMNPENF